MAAAHDAQSLLDSAREQVQQLFKPRASAKSFTEGNGGSTADSAERRNLSPSASIEEALHGDELLTFSTPVAAADGGITFLPQASQPSATSSRGATAGTDKDPDAASSAAEGDSWEGADGSSMADAAAADHAAVGHAVQHDPSAPSATAGAEAAASPRGVADGLKLLLGADEEELASVLRAHRAAVGTRTAAGLQKVEGLSTSATLGLLTLAVAAVVWGHGLDIARFVFGLWREHASDLVAGGCVLVLALKWALPRIRSIPGQLDEVCQAALDMQATIQYIRAMHADTHAIRAIMEKMSADLESKTAWIPTGVKPPAWLAGKK